jgi:hypothetical protein
MQGMEDISHSGDMFSDAPIDAQNQTLIDQLKIEIVSDSNIVRSWGRPARFSRFYTQRYWLELHGDEVDMVFHTDSFDALFQVDIFQYLRPNGLTFVTEPRLVKECK